MCVQDCEEKQVLGAVERHFSDCNGMSRLIVSSLTAVGDTVCTYPEFRPLNENNHCRSDMVPHATDRTDRAVS